MFNWLKRIRSSSKPARVSDRQGLLFRFLRGRYDAATTTDENRRHWANADNLSADVANSPQIRRTLRNRSRYEVANNSYARGIVLTLANDLVGTGPRLQMLTDDPEANRQIEREFAEWSKAVGLAEKLRTMRMARKLAEVEKHYDFYSALYRQYVGDLLKLAIHVRQIVTRSDLRDYLAAHRPEDLAFFESVLAEREGKAAG